MRLLLDTHVVLWWLADSPELSSEVKDMLDREADAYVSAVTPWEVAIKQSIGKLKGPGDLAERVQDSEFNRLPITAAHAVRAGRLPLHHRDPFDRILIAQAQAEGLTLMSRDKWVQEYEVLHLEV